MTSPNFDRLAKVIADNGFAKPQTLTDATFIAGAIIDTIPEGMQRVDQILALFSLAFTSSSGAAGATVIANITTYHDTASDMSGEAALTGGAYSKTFTWVADGANYGILAIPVSLAAANRYVRVKAKITESGTITVGTPLGCIAVVSGGLHVMPDSGYTSTGYSNITEPTA